MDELEEDAIRPIIADTIADRHQRETHDMTTTDTDEGEPLSAWPHGAPRVGQRASMSRTIEDTDIVRFTEISGDRNPLHYDAAAAARTRFGQIVVQGGVTSAILNAVAAEQLPGPGTVFLETRWRFLAPTHPGDTITGEVEVTAVREDKPITTLATRVVRDDGVVAIEGTAVCWTMDLGSGDPLDEQRNRVAPATLVVP